MKKIIYLYNLITLCFFGTTSVQCVERTLYREGSSGQKITYETFRNFY